VCLERPSWWQLHISRCSHLRKQMVGCKDIQGRAKFCNSITQNWAVGRRYFRSIYLVNDFSTPAEI